ncbi:MAG: OsmC family protein [Brevefilum sp.]|nr:OsmC family protein [Brevefilum sp.]MDT8382543.1 OsmC family protein [Brevefilum sp.]MDW7754106.1 OsmC family protein [Brevefilum sp.]
MKVTAKNLTNLQVQLKAGNHVFIADEPLGVGDDAGPDPYALLLSALGACKVMTVLMYARKKGWPLEDVEVSLETYKIHAKDCENCESDPDAMVSMIEAEISFGGDLTDEQIDRLGEISTHCPVHRTLTGEIKVKTEVKKIIKS